MDAAVSVGGLVDVPQRYDSPVADLARKATSKKAKCDEVNTNPLMKRGFLTK